MSQMKEMQMVITDLLGNEWDKDGNMILARIPSTVLVIAKTIFSYQQDPNMLDNNGYVRMPPDDKVFADAKLVSDARFLTHWLKLIDHVFPVCDDMGDRFAIHCEKLAQVKYSIIVSGRKFPDYPYKNMRTGETNIDSISVRIDAEVLNSILNPPDGFIYEFTPDNHECFKNDLSENAIKLCDFIFSLPAEYATTHSRFLQTIGQDWNINGDVVKAKKYLTKAFNELSDAGLVKIWCMEGVGKQSVKYIWQRIEFGEETSS